MLAPSADAPSRSSQLRIAATPNASEPDPACAEAPDREARVRRSRAAGSPRAAGSRRARRASTIGDDRSSRSAERREDPLDDPHDRPRRRARAAPARDAGALDEAPAGAVDHDLGRPSGRASSGSSGPSPTTSSNSSRPRARSCGRSPSSGSSSDHRARRCEPGAPIGARPTNASAPSDASSRGARTRRECGVDVRARTGRGHAAAPTGRRPDRRERRICSAGRASGSGSRSARTPASTARAIATRIGDAGDHRAPEDVGDLRRARSRVRAPRTTTSPKARPVRGDARTDAPQRRGSSRGPRASVASRHLEQRSRRRANRRCRRRRWWSGPSRSATASAAPASAAGRRLEDARQLDRRGGQREPGRGLDRRAGRARRSARSGPASSQSVTPVSGSAPRPKIAGWSPPRSTRRTRTGAAGGRIAQAAAVTDVPEPPLGDQNVRRDTATLPSDAAREGARTK